MRTPSDNIFRLIKSMTGPEKGYFKKISSANKDKNNNKYLKLFRLIDAQVQNKNYNETLVRTGFKSDSIVNNLHVAKGYLYKLILKNLVQFHSENSASINITNIYNGAVILYKKGLYKEAQAQIYKCKSLIYKRHAEEFLFPLLKLERYMISILNNSEPENEFIKNSDESVKVMELMSNISMYNEHFGKLLHYYNEKQIIRDKEKTDNLNSLLNNRYMKNEGSAITTESKILFNKFFYNYSLSLSNDVKMYEHSKRIIEIIENNPFHKNEFPHEYIAALTGYLTSVTFLKNYKEADEAIRKLKNIESNSTYISDQIYIIIYNFELIKLIQTGEFKKGLKLIPEIEKTINEFEEKKKPLKHKFCYSIAYLYFGAGMYEKAIEWLNKIFSDNSTDIRQDLLSFAHILNLISHFELDNRDYLFYTIKNTYRFLEKRQKLYKVESAVLNFLRKTPGLVSMKEMTPNFQELLDNLIDITEDPYEKIALDYFDFVSWLESKIKKKKFADVVKSKSL